MFEQQSALANYLRALRRQSWLIILTVTLALGAAAVTTTLQDRVYRSSMKLIVGQGGGTFDPRFGNTVETFTQTMTNLLESDIVARRVIERVGASSGTRHFLHNLGVFTRPESAVLEVTYDAPTQAQATEILDAVGVVFTGLVDEKLTALQGTDIAITASVFDPAHASPGQVAPRPVRNLAFAGALGLVLGLLIAFVRESLDDRVRGRQDAEEWFRSPVIGALPKGMRGKPAFGIARRPVAARADHAEAVQLLRARLQFAEGGTSGPTTLVTSALPEEGKSTVVAHLGVSLALSGLDVICVDADLRRPRLHHYLDVSPGPVGLADVIEGRASVAAGLVEVPLVMTGQVAAKTSARVGLGDETRAGAGSSRRSERREPFAMETQPEERGRGRLRVLPAGTATTSPGDLLTGERIEALMDELRATAQYILVDTPPILLVGDAFPLLRVVDNVIIVARAGQSNKNAAELVRSTLDSLAVARRSVVLTDARPEDSTGAYGYGYTYGS